MFLEWLLSHKAAVAFWFLFILSFLKLAWLLKSIPKGDDQGKGDKLLYGLFSLGFLVSAAMSTRGIALPWSFFTGLATAVAANIWVQMKYPHLVPQR